MSIQTIQLTPAEEKYVPPGQVIELAVLPDIDGPVTVEFAADGQTREFRDQVVLLTVCKYTEDSDGSRVDRIYEVPPIRVGDLVRALAAFGIAGTAWHYAPVPLRLPAAPIEEPSS